MIDNGVWAHAPERFALPQVYHEVAAVIGWDAAVDFGMSVWQTKRPPSQQKTDQVHGGGRGTIYIPNAINDHAGRELIALAGIKTALRLVDGFGGESLQFPCIVTASLGRRNRAISKQVADGHSVRSVAWCFDLTDRQVRRIVRKETASNVF